MWPPSGPLHEKAMWVGAKSRELTPARPPETDRANVDGIATVRTGVSQPGTRSPAVSVAAMSTRSAVLEEGMTREGSRNCGE